MVVDNEINGRLALVTGASGGTGSGQPVQGIFLQTEHPWP